MVLGVVMVVIGLLFWFGDRIPWLGKLPGDILIRREKVTIYIPILTMLILSILITIILNLFRKWWPMGIFGGNGHSGLFRVAEILWISVFLIITCRPN